MPSTPEEQIQSMINNLPAKTGKSLEQWFKLIKSKGLEKHSEIMKLIKDEHGVSYGFANTIALLYRQQAGATPSGDADLVAAQYAGAKAALKPLYEHLLKAAQALGSDVSVSPKKANVSLRRNKQFAIIQPSTKDRIDLGLILRKTPAKGRLEAWEGMCTHRVRLTSAKDFDKEVKAWLKQAYEEA
jgi:hypothetical protein